MKPYFSHEADEGSYFKNMFGDEVLNETAELPCSTTNFTWERRSNPERLCRIFEFDTIDVATYFVEQVLDMQIVLGHYGKVTLDFPAVDIEVYTKDYDAITDLDLEYTRAVEKILHDSHHIGDGRS